MLVLASASPRRRELLEAAGFRVECVVSGAAEIEDHTMLPAELALENARRKVELVARAHPSRMVLGADTVVHDGGRFFGKPVDLAEAREFLRGLAGRTHEVVTGVVIRPPGGPLVEFAESTRVTFHPLDDAAISDYLSVIDPLDKAGGYAAQGEGSRIIRSLEGTLSNVIGLPVERVCRELARLGFSA